MNEDLKNHYVYVCTYMLYMYVLKQPWAWLQLAKNSLLV